MRIILLLALLVSFNPALAGDGYIIIDMVKPPLTTRQPTWIGLRKKARLIHIPTGQTVTSLPSGKYFFDHIGFQKNKLSASGTFFSYNKRKLSFEVKENSILYVGMLQIGDRSSSKGRQRKISTDPTNTMLRWACASHSELLTRLPIRVLQENGVYKEIKVHCKS